MKKAIKVRSKIKPRGMRIKRRARFLELRAATRPKAMGKSGRRNKRKMKIRANPTTNPSAILISQSKATFFQKIFIREKAFEIDSKTLASSTTRYL
jgi:hypothetical protein